jgi:hypothetical protein
MRLLRPRPKECEDDACSNSCNVGADCASRDGPAEELEAIADGDPEAMASYRCAAFFGDVMVSHYQRAMRLTASL